MRSRKFLFCGIVFMLATFFMVLLSTAGGLKSLRDVDLVDTSAYVKNGVLKIGFHYQNRDRDELVFWEKGKVSCNCKLYENVGNILDEKKGRKIISITKKVRTYSQDIYVDVPNSHLNKGKRGILECVVNTGYKKLKMKDEISLDDL